MKIQKAQRFGKENVQKAKALKHILTEVCGDNPTRKHQLYQQIKQIQGVSDVVKRSSRGSSQERVEQGVKLLSTSLERVQDPVEIPLNPKWAEANAKASCDYYQKCLKGLGEDKQRKAD